MLKVRPFYSAGEGKEKEAMNKRIQDRKIVLELSEHEALQILTLIRKQIRRSDKIWQPYWEDQAEKVQQSIEQAAYLQSSTCSEYISG